MAAALGKLFAWPRSTVGSRPTLPSGCSVPHRRRRVTGFSGPDEIISFWRACDAIGWPFGHVFKLLLLTAQRRSEVSEMVWAELSDDLSVWCIPPSRTKKQIASRNFLASARTDHPIQLPARRRLCLCVLRHRRHADLRLLEDQVQARPVDGHRRGVALARYSEGLALPA